MSGLVTVLPLALTVYVIWWLVHTVEGWLRRALIALGIVSPEHYWPGLGLIAGFLLLLFVGSVVNAYAGKILLKYWDDFLGRIPFVKTLYGGFRDVVSLLPSGSGEKRDLQRVVLARFADVHAIGFVTREDVPTVLLAHGGAGLGDGVFSHELCIRRLHHLSAARPGPAARHFRRGCHAFGDHRRADGCRQAQARSAGLTVVKHGLKFLILGLAMSQPVAALATTAPGVKPGSPADKYQVWRNEAVRVLAARADANSLATAAALSFSKQLCRACGRAHGAAIDRPRERAGAGKRGDRLAASAAVRGHSCLRQPRRGIRAALGGSGQRRGLARPAIDRAQGQGHGGSRTRAGRHGARARDSICITTRSW